MSVYLGVVLFGTYFPFTAKQFKSKGYCKHVHITVVILAVLCSAALVGAQLAMGGYTRTMVPIFCLAGVDSAFWYAVVPPCFLAAVFLTLVMVLLFKIIDREQWQCVKMKVS